MSRSRKIILGIVVLAILAAAATSEVLRSDRGIEVRVDTVQKREIVSTITATGQVRARRQVNISSDVMGRVTRLTVEEGDEVQAGEVLLTVDPTQIQAQLSRARATLSQAQAQVTQQRANLDQAERELARLQGIIQQDPDLVSRQSVDDAQTRVEVQRALLTSSSYGAEQAEAGVRETEDQLEKTTIRSPIAGRVVRLNIEEGETAVVGTMNNPGSLLLTIADLSTVEAVMAVDETDVPKISVGDSAVVELDAFPDQLFAAEVTSIGNSAIQGSQNQGSQAQGNVDFEVILTLLDPPNDLRPDLSATADIIVNRVLDAPSVPIISVVTRSPSGEAANASANASVDEDDADEGPASPIARSQQARPVEGVFIVREGRAVWTPVTLGLTGQEHFEVLSGVEVGDTVVSGPYQTIQDLADGTEVRATSDDGTATAS
jgi:HlyD family secretion protein